MRNFGLMAATLAVGMVLGGAAWAVPSATVAPTEHSVQGGGNTANVYGFGYGGTTPVGGGWNENPLVIPPPGNSGVYQSPFNNTGLSESRRYFSTGGTDANGEGSLSPLTLTFENPIDAFSILWGSIDNYNTISFFNAVNALPIFQLTGAALMALIDPSLVNPNPSHNYEHVALVNFHDLGGAVRAVFESGQGGGQTPAFEFALAVPVPAALPLFGCAIGGLVLLRARRSKRGTGSPVLA